MSVFGVENIKIFSDVILRILAEPHVCGRDTLTDKVKLNFSFTSIQIKDSVI